MTNIKFEYRCAAEYHIVRKKKLLKREKSKII